ncbi:hypothetical protein DFJ74DRAFT_671796 [Hyaloraphidium curvatum]|nr:hypothetical protein DFJ74DRAFT_671796 [Hyaloraphidium curvatum]
MSFSFKKAPAKARRNFRVGVERDGSPEETAEGSGLESGTPAAQDEGETSAVKRRDRGNKKEGGRKAGKMTFGADEEPAEVFKLVKSASPAPWPQGAESLRMDSGREGHGGTRYDAEHLEELRKSISAPPALQPNRYSADQSMEDVADTIPDDAAVLAARRLREQRRAAGEREEKEDFIPLDGKPKTRESRLVTEDQLVEDEEEFEDYSGDRIAFGAKTAKQRKTERRREIEATLLARDQSESDEDLEEVNGEHGAQTGIFGLSAPPLLDNGRAEDSAMPSGAVLASMGAVNARLNGLLLGNDEILAALRQKTTELSLELAAAEGASGGLSRDMESSGDRYNFFQDLRMYVNSLADFFDEKLPQLIALEDEHEAYVAKLVAQRKEARYASVDADYEIITGFAPRRPSVEQELEARDPDGTTIERLEKSHRHLFDDSLESYSQLQSIRDTLISWKMRFPGDYERAFGSLSVPGAFELAVRHELFGWFPFQALVRLEDMEWHRTVASFDSAYAHEDEEPHEMEVLNAIVKSVCIPRLKARLPMFDVWSASETRNLASLLAEIRDYVATDSPAYKGIVSIVNDLFAAAVGECAERYGVEAPHLQTSSPPSPEVLAARTRFFEGLFPLVQNAVTLRRYLGSSAVTELCSGLMGRVVVVVLSSVTPASLKHDIGLLQKVCAAVQPYGSEEDRASMKHALRKWTFKLRLLSSSRPDLLDMIDSLDLL